MSDLVLMRCCGERTAVEVANLERRLLILRIRLACRHSRDSDCYVIDWVYVNDFMDS